MLDQLRIFHIDLLAPSSGRNGPIYTAQKSWKKRFRAVKTLSRKIRSHTNWLNNWILTALHGMSVTLACFTLCDGSNVPQCVMDVTVCTHLLEHLHTSPSRTTNRTGRRYQSPRHTSCHNPPNTKQALFYMKCIFAEASTSLATPENQTYNLGVASPGHLTYTLQI